MKTPILIKSLLFAVITIVISSCGSSTDVASNGLIQKRKYRKGFHLKPLRKKQEKPAVIPEEVIAQAQTQQYFNKQNVSTEFS